MQQSLYITSRKNWFPKIETTIIKDITKTARDNGVKNAIVSLFEAFPKQIQTSCFGKLCGPERLDLDLDSLLGKLGTEHWKALDDLVDIALLTGAEGLFSLKDLRGQIPPKILRDMLKLVMSVELRKFDPLSTEGLSLLEGLSLSLEAKIEILELIKYLFNISVHTEQSLFSPVLLDVWTSELNYRYEIYQYYDFYSCNPDFEELIHLKADNQGLKSPFYLTLEFRQIYRMKDRKITLFEQAILESENHMKRHDL
jgi:hypothetical protein